MNKDRRTRIKKVCQQLSEIQEELYTLHSEEQEAFDNLLESLQASEKANRMEECATALDEAMQAVEDVVNNLNELVID
jgi:formiminotetrahydrofolate cyclodeaminase